MKNNQNRAEPASEPEVSARDVQAALDDEYAGQGGSYALDPETGLRTLIARTEQCTDCRK